MSNGITLEKLNIIIKGSSEDAEKSVNRLIDELTRLKIAAGNMATAGNVASQSIKNMGKTADQVASNMGGVAKSSGDAAKNIEGVADAEIKVTEEAKRTKDATSQVNKELGNTGKQAKSTSRDVDKASKSINNHTSSVKKLISSLGRIAFYRMIRSAIKEVTQAVAEGGQALVEWDREFTVGVLGVRRISASVDELKSKWKETGGAVAALGLTLLQSVQPAVSWTLNAVTTVANYIQQIVRGLRGETKWYHAVYKEAAATTGQAKELQRVLFGFDELNVLPSKNGSGGGAIGGWHNQLEDIDDSILNVTDKVRGVVDALGGWKNVLLGGLGLIALLKLLNKLLGGKNKNLGEENKQLQADAAYSYAFSSALQTAGSKVGAFSALLGAIPLLDLGQQKGEILDYSSLLGALDLNINPGEISLEQQKKELQSYQALLEGLDLNLTPTVDLSSALTAGVAAARYAQGGASLTPVQIFSVMSAMGLDASINSTLNSIQQLLSVNPEKIPVTLFSDLLGQQLADLLNKLQAQLNGQPLQIKVQTVQESRGGSNTYTATNTQSTYSPVKGKTYDVRWVDPTPAVTTPATKAIHGHKVSALELDPSYGYSSASSAFASGARSASGTATASSGLSSILSDIQKSIFISSGAGAKKVQDNKALTKALELEFPALSSEITGGLTLAALMAALGTMGIALPGLFANGGTPDMGTLFYAGERGPEVVSRMGNNQSGVMNVMQMQAAMEGANRGVESAVYVMMNAVVNAIRNKDTNVYMDSEIISRKVTRAQNNTARRFGEAVMM